MEMGCKNHIYCYAVVAGSPRKTLDDDAVVMTVVPVVSKSKSNRSPDEAALRLATAKVSLICGLTTAPCVPVFLVALLADLFLSGVPTVH